MNSSSGANPPAAATAAALASLRDATDISVPAAPSLASALPPRANLISGAMPLASTTAALLASS